MEEKRSPIVAGLGGAALAAALVTMGGSSSTSSTDSRGHKAEVVQSSSDHADITSNQEGPWYAFCQEYSTTEFDHGEDPAEQRGIRGHRVPEEAEEGTADITKTIRINGKLETETFHVRKHTIGELSSCMQEGEKLRVAIATVPDPNATQMRLDFDRDVRSIQAAAASEHYDYTRFWFPWRADDWTLDKSSDPEAEIRRRQEPGILCFRKNSGAVAGGVTDRLFVLLVGETPTSGVNRIQFAHALYYAEQLTGPTITLDKKLLANPSKQDHLDIAGPFFSASFYPIQDVLKKLNWERMHPPAPKPGLQAAVEPLQKASLVSPSASGEQFISDFRSFCTGNGLCGLQTLALPANQVREETLAFLTEKFGYEPNEVAQLSEDESAFGESQTAALRNPARKPDPDYGLKLHFPRDLSSVRSLSDEQSAKVAEAGSKYFTLPNSSLPTRLAAQQPIDRDSPAAFGAEQATGEVARALAEVVAHMRSHHIRAVVLTASNPLDRIYLLEYLHNQLPEVRAVTVDVDTLELDRPHFIDLTGTLGVTAMPPLADMSVGTKGPGEDHAPRGISFASSGQEGEFLAMQTLLHKEADRLTTDARPACFHFSIVGAGGFRLLPGSAIDKGEARFPCAVLNGEANTNAPQSQNPTTFLTVHVQNHLPDVLLAFAGLIFLWNLFHLFSLYNSSRRVDGFFSYAAQLLDAQEPDRFYLLFAANNQPLILNVTLTWLAFRCLMSDLQPGSHETALWGIACIFALLALVALGISFILFARFVRSLKQATVDQGLLRRRWQQMVIATFYLVSSLGMVFLLPFHSAGEGIFLERITHLGDGLSPLLPITAILLGYFLWGRLQLRRLAWAASRKPHLTFSPATNEFLHTSIDHIQFTLDELIPTDDRITGVSFGLAVLVAIVLRKSLNGLEGVWFHAWFTVWGVGMLLLTVTMTYTHAWLIWNRLRKLLVWLETTEMSATFVRLGQSGVVQVKMWDLAKMEKNLSFLRSTIESLRSIKGSTSSEAVEAEAQFTALLQADRYHQQLSPQQIENFSKALNVSMDDAVNALPARTSSVLNRDELRAFLALRLISMIRYAMLHIGAMISFVAYGFVLAVGSIMFYPFEGRKTIGGLLVITFVALLSWMALMIIQFQSNAMLSHLGGGKSGETNYGQAALHLLTVGGLPLIAILTSQFPGIANFAYTFFRPLLSALH